MKRLSFLVDEFGNIRCEKAIIGARHVHAQSNPYFRNLACYDFEREVRIRVKADYKKSGPQPPTSEYMKRRGSSPDDS